VLEAMSMARPIITTDVPGCRETVIDGENGFLIQSRSAGALAEAMEKLIDDPALRAKMGVRSRALCERKFDVTQVTAVLLRHLSLA
jgi:glycosyltransferase involved in cell wall biosynthesis